MRGKKSEKLVIKMKKTLVIGLGGTGVATLGKIKSHLYALYGELPPQMRFFGFDTVDPPVGLDLKSYEFYKLKLSDADKWIKSKPEIQAWWPDMAVRTNTLIAGANQSRPMGRLALFANAQDVHGIIDRLISAMNSFNFGHEKGMKNDYESINDRVHVILVSSLAGGTGSGIVTDLAFLVRDKLSCDLGKLNAYLLLPDIFMGFPAHENVGPNTYAALKEIDHLMSGGRYPSPYVFDGNAIEIQDGLFNEIYLINKLNENGFEVNSISELLEAMAHGIIYQSSVIGKQVSDVIDNLQVFRILWEGEKRPNYLSLGLSELVLPIDDYFSKLFVLKTAENIIRETCFQSAESDLNTYLEDFIDGNCLKKEEDSHQKLINSILPDGCFKKFIPPESSKDTVSEALKNLVTHLDTVENDLNNKAGAALKKIRAEKFSNLKSNIESMLMTPRMVISCDDFCKSLLGRLDGYIDELKKRIYSYSEQLNESAAQDLKSAQEKVKQAADSILLFRPNRIQSAIQELYRVVENRSRVLLEKIRHEHAIKLLTAMKIELDYWIKRIDNFFKNMDGLIHEFQIERASLSYAYPGSFVKQLRPKKLQEKIMVNSADAFLKWMKDRSAASEKGYDFLSFFDLETTKEEIKGRLVEFAKQTNDVKDLQELRLVDELKRYKDRCKKENSADFDKLLADLDHMCAPLWQLQKMFIGCDKRVETINIIGNTSDDMADMPFDLSELKIYPPDVFAPLVVPMKDKQRMIFLKISGYVPAYVLRNIEKYKYNYEYKMRQTEKSCAFHIHKDWEILENSPLADLIPDLCDEDRDAGEPAT